MGGTRFVPEHFSTGRKTSTKLSNEFPDEFNLAIIIPEQNIVAILVSKKVFIKPFSFLLQLKKLSTIAD